MQAMMVDLETLATGPRAVFWQIGWVYFDPYGTEFLKGQVWEVDILDSLQHNRMIDQSTVDFWKARDRVREAREYTKVVPMEMALYELNEAYKNNGCREIWANSPSFDCAIIADAMQSIGRKTPWSFRDERDVRTLKRVAEQILGYPINAPREPTHDALMDAHDQALMVQEITLQLRGRK